MLTLVKSGQFVEGYVDESTKNRGYIQNKEQNLLDEHIKYRK